MGVESSQWNWVSTDPWRPTDDDSGVARNVTWLEGSRLSCFPFSFPFSPPFFLFLFLPSVHPPFVSRLVYLKRVLVSCPGIGGAWAHYHPPSVYTTEWWWRAVREIVGARRATDRERWAAAAADSSCRALMSGQWWMPALIWDHCPLSKPQSQPSQQWRTYIRRRLLKTGWSEQQVAVFRRTAATFRQRR